MVTEDNDNDGRSVAMGASVHMQGTVNATEDESDDVRAEPAPKKRQQGVGRSPGPPPPHRQTSPPPRPQGATEGGPSGHGGSCGDSGSGARSGSGCAQGTAGAATSVAPRTREGGGRQLRERWGPRDLRGTEP